MRNTIRKLGLALSLVMALACSKKDEAQPISAPAPGTPGAAAKVRTTPGTADEPAAPGTAEPPGTPGTAAPGTASTPSKTASRMLVELPPVENPPAAGPVYFVVQGIGVVAVTDGKFVSLAAPEKSFKELAVGGDGKVYVAGSRAIYRIEGEELVKVPGSGTVDHLAVGADGQIWTTSFRHIMHFDGMGWTTEEKAVLGADVALLKGIALDGTGRPWIASANGVHVRDGETWKTEDLSGLGKDKFFFDAIVAGPDGTMLAVASTDVLKWKGGRWELLSLADQGEYLGSGAKVALAAGGRLCVAFNLGALGCLLPDGSRVRKDWKAEEISALLRGLTMDGAGRLWVASEAGLEVFAPGGTSTRWAPGTIAEAPSDIVSLVALGGGPVLPAVGEARTGTVHGKITRKDGTPLAGKPMEICSSPNSTFRETPCTGAAFVATSTTTDQGEFTFENVPIGNYGFSIEVDGKWSISSYMDGCCEQLQPGQVLEVGPFELD